MRQRSTAQNVPDLHMNLNKRTLQNVQPKISVGLSLHLLADLLLKLNATEAINLDGVGSTTMVVKQKVANRHSDQTGERPVSDAILVFSRAK